MARHPLPAAGRGQRCRCLAIFTQHKGRAVSGAAFSFVFLPRGFFCACSNPQLGGVALELDRGAEFVPAGIAGPGVMDHAVTHKLGMLRRELKFPRIAGRRGGQK